MPKTNVSAATETRHDNHRARTYTGAVVSRWLNKISWPALALVCGTLGLAPFSPRPHVWEKLTMLASGDLTRPIDIFDLALHGAPWLLLAAKLLATLRATASETSE